MSEYISLGDSLIVTLFSITMVFVVLVVISIFISLLKNLDPKEKVEPTTETDVVAKTSSKEIETEEDNITNDEELVAVISAAIAASLGVSVPEINIKKINRVSGSSIAWAVASKQEQMYNKL